MEEAKEFKGLHGNSVFIYDKMLAIKKYPEPNKFYTYDEIESLATNKPQPLSDRNQILSISIKGISEPYIIIFDANDFIVFGELYLILREKVPQVSFSLLEYLDGSSTVESHDNDIGINVLEDTEEELNMEEAREFNGRFGDKVSIYDGMLAIKKYPKLDKFYLFDEIEALKITEPSAYSKLIISIKDISEPYEIRFDEKDRTMFEELYLILRESAPQASSSSYLDSSFAVKSYANVMTPKFCSECGTKVEGMKFCPECGTPTQSNSVNTQQISTAPPVQPAQPVQPIQPVQQEVESNEAHCPRCHSTSLSANKKGFGIGKALVGASLAGGVGLLAGNIGAKKVRITCLNCGYQYWAGKR